MKTLKDQIDLTHEVETISITEFRGCPGECLRQVELGKTFCLTRRGEPVAFLTPSADIIHEVAPDGSCKTLGVVAKKETKA